MQIKFEFEFWRQWSSLPIRETKFHRGPENRVKDGDPGHQLVVGAATLRQSAYLFVLTLWTTCFLHPFLQLSILLIHIHIKFSK